MKKNESKKPAVKGQAKPRTRKPAKAAPAKASAKLQPVPASGQAKDAKRKDAARKRALAERLRIVEKVCGGYRHGDVTLETACAQAGISRKTFYLWREEDPRIADAWHTARSEARTRKNEVLAEAALDSMLRLVRGYDHEETQHFGKVVVDENGTRRVIPDRVVKTTRHIPPHPGMVAMCLRNLHGWRDRLEVNHSGEVTVTRQVMIIGGKEIVF